MDPKPSPTKPRQGRQLIAIARQTRQPKPDGQTLSQKCTEKREHRSRQRSFAACFTGTVQFLGSSRETEAGTKCKEIELPSLRCPGRCAAQGRAIEKSIVEKAVSSRETRGGNTFHAGEGSMNEKTKKRPAKTRETAVPPD